MISDLETAAADGVDPVGAQLPPTALCVAHHLLVIKAFFCSIYFPNFSHIFLFDVNLTFTAGGDIG